MVEKAGVCPSRFSHRIEASPSAMGMRYFILERELAQRWEDLGKGRE